MTNPRILILDIETRPAVGYIWRMWDENVSVDQLLDPGGVICFGAKWLGEKTCDFYSDWQHGHDEMIRHAHRLLSECDAIVTFNGDSFDLPKLQGEFVLAGLKPPPPVTSIDVRKTTKKLGFISGKLAFLGPHLKLGHKVKHNGFELWADVNKGLVSAQKMMEKYCIQDVVLLEKVYKKIRPYVKNHPHMASTKGHECGACGSKHLQSRGWRRTKSFRIQRLQCQSCGSWQDGRREKLT